MEALYVGNTFHQCQRHPLRYEYWVQTAGREADWPCDYHELLVNIGNRPNFAVRQHPPMLLGAGIWGILSIMGGILRYAGDGR